MYPIAVLFNPKRKEALPLAEQICHWLRAGGKEAWSRTVDDAAYIEARIDQLELVVVLGGDGTTLQAARWAAPHDVPIFGVNLGRVGFLSESDPNNWEERLGRVLRDEHWLERRLMLSARVVRAGEPLGVLAALNDVVVSRSAKVRVVRFHLYVDDYHVTTYTADGLIAATPTGSTAYSMAAGGPLLPPQLQNFLVLPVAAHLSFERPLVLHQDAAIKIEVEMENEALVTADGQDALELQNGDVVEIRKHSCKSLFARVGGPNYFYHRLMQRLSYWSRKQ
ncbi:MAG: NAD(+)/NADH kinase [Candidatus Promineifilaceae bacterium]|nr:NAD(+)/NADH kinase [Candidatus Promineifilaceae bacterium]